MEFSEALASLEAPSSTLEVAVDEILECESLIQVLLVILNAGNIINAVSYKLYKVSPFSFTSSSLVAFSSGNVSW